MRWTLDDMYDYEKNIVPMGSGTHPTSFPTQWSSSDTGATRLGKV